MDEWRISLELDPTEIPALQNALLGVIPDERHALITSGWEEDPEDAYLSITVAADSEQSATRQAVGLYAEVRTAAGLGQQNHRSSLALLHSLWGRPATV